MLALRQFRASCSTWFQRRLPLLFLFSRFLPLFFSFPSICYPFCQLLAIAELKEIKAFVDILPALS